MSMEACLVELATASLVVRRVREELEAGESMETLGRMVEKDNKESSGRDKDYELEETVSLALECLEVPSIFDDIHDRKIYAPSSAASLEEFSQNYRKAVTHLLQAFEQLLNYQTQSIPESQSKPQSKTPSKTPSKPQSKPQSVPQVLTADPTKRESKSHPPLAPSLAPILLRLAAGFANPLPYSEWADDSTKQAAERLLKTVAKTLTLTSLEESQHSDSHLLDILLETYAARALRQLNARRKAKGSVVGADKTAFSQPHALAFEWIVKRIRHPLISEIFSVDILAPMLALVDDHNTHAKAIGVRVMCHSCQHLMTTEIRFHASIMLHRLTKAMAFHTGDVESSVLDTVIAILPRLDKSDKVTRPLSLQLIGKVVSEIHFIALSNPDVPNDRLNTLLPRIPALIHSFAHDLMRFSHEILDSLARISLLSPSVARFGVLGLRAVINKLPNRAKAKRGLLFEILSRAYLRHSLRLDNTNNQNHTKIHTKLDTKIESKMDMKSGDNVQDSVGDTGDILQHLTITIQTLRKVCRGSLELYLEESCSRISDLRPLNANLKSLNTGP